MFVWKKMNLMSKRCQLIGFCMNSGVNWDEAVD